ncbi:MAG: hypothetical protein RLZZ585_349 [Bacteroidota bacterium]|jgi:hypothetical protein
MTKNSNSANYGEYAINKTLRKLTIALIIQLFVFNVFSQEVFYPKLNTTFNFYLREITQTESDFEIHFALPNDALFERTNEWGTDGFGVIADRKTIVFYGSTEQAIEHAIYYTLEHSFGIRFISAEETYIPKQARIKALPYTTYEEVPAFEYREVFYGEARRAGYAESFFLTDGQGSGNFERHPGWGLWVHTLHRLLPPETYFESHPEYYALRNGVRMRDQLCLSNPEVLTQVSNALQLEVNKRPNEKYWSVSQMDNYNYCECEKCAHIDEEEGSHSGSIIRFVNEIAKRFPDKVISTLAYQYSRTAPKVTKPLPNVNIMLCTIEENRAKSLMGTGFEKDLSDWSKISQNILIWDYVINFSHMVMPFPNWPTLQENIQLFKKYGVNMLFEQGYNQSSSEMQELRCFLLSKWMWDPNLDRETLTNTFLSNYYGVAGPIVKEILDREVSELQKSGKSLTLYEPPMTHIKGYLSPENLHWYHNMFEKAKNMEGLTPKQIERIQMAQQSMRYASLEISKSPDAGKDWYFYSTDNPYDQMLTDFVRLALKNGPKLLHEIKLSPKEYEQITRDYWKNGKVKHLASNGTLKYLNIPNSSYQDGAKKTDGSSIDTLTFISGQPLINGIKGTTDYQYNWQGWQGRNAELIIDLGKIDSISNIRLNFLENNSAWIVGPKSLNVHIATNLAELDASTSFQGSIENPDAGKQLPAGTYPLQLTLPSKTAGRFIYIQVINPGALPKWRGVDGDGWLFIDEIEIH